MYERVKSIILAVAIVLWIFMFACDKNLTPKLEGEQPTMHNIRLLARYGINSMELWEVDGCQYVVSYQKSAIHKANCPNHHEQ